MTEEYDADLSSSLESNPDETAENIEMEIKEENITPKKEKKEKKEKVKKQRKPMTPEHKAKLLAGLSKARLASNLARAKRKQVKKIQKEQEDAEVDRILRENLLSKSKKTDDKDKEIERLKKKLENLTLQDVIKKPKKNKRSNLERPLTPEPMAQLEREEDIAEQAEESEEVDTKLDIIKEDKVLEVITPTETLKRRVCKGRKKKGYS